MDMGQRGRDVITGFEGVIIGRCEYFTGCNQILLVPKVDKDGKSEGKWFDDSRIEAFDEPPMTLPHPERVSTAPGADLPAPVK